MLGKKKHHITFETNSNIIFASLALGSNRSSDLEHQGKLAELRRTNMTQAVQRQTCVWTGVVWLKESTQVVSRRGKNQEPDVRLYGFPTVMSAVIPVSLAGFYVYYRPGRLTLGTNFLKYGRSEISQ